MKVSELIEELKTMPQDYDVAVWVGNRWDNDERRVDIIEVRDVGDIVDLYYEEMGDE
jgi:hypothetical protein